MTLYFVADSFIVCITLSGARSKLAQYPSIGYTVAHSRNVIRGANNTPVSTTSLQRLDCRFSIDARRVIGGRTVKVMRGLPRAGFVWPTRGYLSHGGCLGAVSGLGDRPGIWAGAMLGERIAVLGRRIVALKIVQPRCSYYQSKCGKAH